MWNRGRQSVSQSVVLDPDVFPAKASYTNYAIMESGEQHFFEFMLRNLKTCLPKLKDGYDYVLSGIIVPRLGKKIRKNNQKSNVTR